MVREIHTYGDICFIGVRRRCSGSCRFCWQNAGLQIEKLPASKICSDQRITDYISCTIVVPHSWATTGREDVIRNSSLTRGF